MLSELSESLPPPLSESDPSPQWTLDRLFLLPRTRLKYYKKLYSRLLKSTKPGRSDHTLLLSATETLERLFQQVEARLGVPVTGPDFGTQPTGDSVEAQLQLLEQELSPPPPIGNESERRDSHESSQWGSSTTFVSSKFGQYIYSEAVPGIKGHHGTQPILLSVEVRHQ